MHTKFWPENVKGRDHSQDIGIDGRIISERIKIGCSTVMNLQVP
jgi:hypothetical protein